jgi:tRNA uridine 5-carboxymethylaminomethyl modification enzyme
MNAGLKNMNNITDNNSNISNENEDIYGVAVIGGGHAGIEAALASSRMGVKTIIFTLSLDAIGNMPCNPSIGGTGKGHLVFEIDALGGEMAKNIDKSFIQSKMLNLSKGPAVHSLRAQADKAAYSQSMRNVLENQNNLIIKQSEIIDILVENPIAENKLPKVTGVKTFTGNIYECQAVIICTGTYLNARCLCGESISYTGPNGLQAAIHLTKALKKLGIQFRRFKTGTPARMDKRSLDYSKMTEQPGDEIIVPFSYSTDPAAIQKEQVSCYLTYTNEKTHEIIRENLGRSPIYAGIIEGTGTRYCPSIEDKIVKFADKERHQVFLEPEGLYTNEMYVSGMSSSMPEDVQIAMYRTVPGMENCEIVRNAYAIEYDCIDPAQLYATLRFKRAIGLYSAGQINGSSGYEEAAAQGLIAGINAALYLQGKEELILNRSEAYIGVLIDDLVTKENLEPYRMMTSRAEYRLSLRQDNADLRLLERGYQVGLKSETEYKNLQDKRFTIQEEIKRLKNTHIGATKDVQEFLAAHGSALLRSATTLAELICRPELDYYKVISFHSQFDLSEDVIKQVDIEIKYEGYLERQQRQINQFKKMEHRKIPAAIDYDDVPSLRLEARQKLKTYQPLSIGQASRISGVSPADIAVLLVYMEHFTTVSSSAAQHAGGILPGSE